MDTGRAERIFNDNTEIFGVWYGTIFVWPDPWWDRWADGAPVYWEDVWRNAWAIPIEFPVKEVADGDKQRT